MKSTIDISKEILKGKGLSPTFPRVKVFEYLQLHHTHPTVEEIYSFLSPQIPSLSKTTIYNTLHAFAEAGLVHIITIDENEQRFDIVLQNHGHFKCNNCGDVLNFEIDYSTVVIKDLEQFEILEKNVYFHGLCPKCLTIKRRKMDNKKKLTTAAGAPVPDNQNAMTAGPRGPMLLQDVWYLEKLAHFDREVIPERRMHAKGSGAFGKFTVTHDIYPIYKSKDFFQNWQRN